MKRRRFIKAAGMGVVAANAGGLLETIASSAPASVPSFHTRGVVLVPEDFSLRDWPERAARAALTTLALHHGTSPQAVVQFVESDPGRDALARCRRLGLQVEYELHAMKELLPRALFAKDRSLFRMDEKGERVADYNCCVHSTRALEVLAENAVRLAGKLRPTTGRYFLWGDDGVPWCRCPKCRSLSDTEQAVVVENHLVKSLRTVDERATLAHLAYQNTLEPPKQVKPHPALFLEYAPIHRRYDLPYADQKGPDTQDGLPGLDRNLQVFPRDTAQALEYWLDVSLFSQWKRPARKLPWRRDVFLSDLRTYAVRGLRHVTTFSTWQDADYVKAFGEPTSIAEYGKGFAEVSQ
ncbi:MAG: DUF4838 domain-containing protein [Verrucomicrobia bacterium]|nr:DUF4838 domain-containing protein [Verrucomicrobiota bacterium]